MGQGRKTTGGTTGKTTDLQSPSPWGTPARSPELALTWVFPRPGGLKLVPSGDTPALPWTIGRDRDCAVRLDGTEISRRHASLEQPPQNGGWRIVDLGSRNGIHVNGQRVVTAALEAGDVLRVGGWVGVVGAVMEETGAFDELAPGLWGGAALRSALAPLRKAAPSDLPVVLEGETGTGKEVVTRTIHAWSGRSGPLVSVNCAALPEALIEGELFGYRRGAFTGAERSSPGLFRRAHGGTLLLDEVADLPLAAQAKLLRVLEERQVHPLGEVSPVGIDVRIVAAAQQSLHQAVQQGRFRPDLLARLDGVTVRLPPLRQRRDDVLPLFLRLVQQLGGRPTVPAVDADLVERLLWHDWPFNVRELVLVVRRLLVLHGAESTLRATHLPVRFGPAKGGLPPAVEGGAATGSMPARALSPAKREPVELTALVAALRASTGNVARAAAMLGITRQRAYRLMEGNAIDLGALRNREQAPEQ